MEDILARLVALLGQHGEAHWANALKELSSQYAQDGESAKAGILRLYGGMGSLNDVVLHGSDGQWLDSKPTNSAASSTSFTRDADTCLPDEFAGRDPNCRANANLRAKPHQECKSVHSDGIR